MPIQLYSSPVAVAHRILLLVAMVKALRSAYSRPQEKYL